MNMEYDKFMQRWLLISIFILLGFSFFIFPTTDTYYYWTWSKNLQLSYLDGPPLIAYLLWCSTHIFGDNFFAIQFISTLAIYGSSYLIYKIAKECTNDYKTALCATNLWIMYPFATTRFVAVSMTLDGLEVFFSLLLIYITFRWVRFQQPRYIYLMGLSVGLALLAKYNVIILIVGLLLYILSNSNLRKIYLSVHFYYALAIALVIFSPVLMWNFQHDWQSFSYQLNLHQWNGPKGAINSSDKQGLPGIWFYLSSCVFGVLNIFIMLIVYFSLVQKTPTNIDEDDLAVEYYMDKPSYLTWFKLRDNHYNRCLVFIIGFILLFWLYKSYSAHIGLNYMVTLSALLSIILAQQLRRLKYYKFTQLLLFLFIIISITMLLDKSRLHKSDMDNYNKYVKTGLIKRLFIS